MFSSVWLYFWIRWGHTISRDHMFSKRGDFVPSPHQGHIWQSLEILSVMTAGLVLLAPSGEMPGMLLPILHTPTTVNYPSQNVNNVEAETLLQVLFIPQLAPRKGGRMGHLSVSWVRPLGVVGWLKMGMILSVRLNAIKESIYLPFEMQSDGENTTHTQKIILSSETN